MKRKNLILFLMITLVSGCLKKQYEHKDGQELLEELKPIEKQLLEAEEKPSYAEQLSKLEKEPLSSYTIEKRMEETRKYPITKEKIGTDEIDFVVQNLTGKTIYLTCFSYVKKRTFSRWHWDKSTIYKLEDKESVVIDVDTITDERDKKNVYGYLAVFEKEQEAQDSIYELLSDDHKIDIDKIYKLHGKRVVIGIERYGFKKELLDFAIVDKIPDYKRKPELDFIVENKTNRPLFVTCFVYQKKENQPVWRYDKTPVKKVNPDQIAIMDIDTILQKYDRVYMRGYLGVFDETEEKQANEVTYELLPEKNKLELDRIMLLRNKKVVLQAEKYGLLGDIINFAVKPIRKIDFSNMTYKKTKE